MILTRKRKFAVPFPSPSMTDDEESKDDDEDEDNEDDDVPDSASGSGSTSDDPNAEAFPSPSALADLIQEGIGESKKEADQVAAADTSDSYAGETLQLDKKLKNAAITGSKKV